MTPKQRNHDRALMVLLGVYLALIWLAVEAALAAVEHFGGM